MPWMNFNKSAVDVAADATDAIFDASALVAAALYAGVNLLSDDPPAVAVACNNME